MTPAETARALSQWFAVAQREMTWRKTRDPYAVWVSEVMLQQTRVDTVEGYYAKFLARFPDVGTLAAADEDTVLAAWSGLGYYRRARLLHRGAQYVSSELAGSLPSEAAELRRIPGIGPYTAGAIASIAFDRPEPLVDGNVARVLSRLHAIDDPVEQDAKAKRHWNEVSELVQHGSPRVLTQALMELGATVCTPRNPRCEACPVQTSCRAHALGRVHEIPAVRKKVKVSTERYWALMITREDKTLLWQRPSEGLLAGMWCPPLMPRSGRAKSVDVSAVRAFLGFDIDLEVASCAEVKHVFSHRVWQLAAVVGRVRGKAGRRAGTRWIGDGDSIDGGVPTVTRKLLRAAAHHR